MLIGRKVKLVQFAVGVELLGAKMSLASSSNNELTLCELGVIAVSKNTGRTVLIPFPNCKGIELLGENEQPKPKKSKLVTPTQE